VRAYEQRHKHLSASRGVLEPLAKVTNGIAMTRGGCGISETREAGVDLSQSSLHISERRQSHASRSSRCGSRCTGKPCDRVSAVARPKFSQHILYVVFDRALLDE